MYIEKHISVTVCYFVCAEPRRDRNFDRSEEMDISMSHIFRLELLFLTILLFVVTLMSSTVSVQINHDGFPINIPYIHERLHLCHRMHMGKHVHVPVAISVSGGDSVDLEI